MLAIGPKKIGEIYMNALNESSEEFPQEQKTEPRMAWVVAWDGTKQVELHKTLNQFNPPRAVIVSGGCLLSLELLSDVFDTEYAACVAGWLKLMEEAAAKMKQAEAFKKRSDELVRVTEPATAWIVAWDGVKTVMLHQILNQFEPRRVLVESRGVVSVEMASHVYDNEADANHAGWLLRMEEAATKMRQADAFKKRADELKSK